MKIRVNTFDLESEKIINDIRIILLSDIHNDIKLFEYILKRVEDLKPDYVCVVGDSLDYVNSDYKKLIQFYKSLSTLTNKIIVSSGNHDLLDFINKQFVPATSNQFFQEINEIESVVPLTDLISQTKESFNGNNLSFNAINMPAEWYEDKKEKEEDFYDAMSGLSHVPIDKGSFNFLLSHSPRWFIKHNKLITAKEMPVIENIDLIQSGHYHAGLVPRVFQSVIPMNMGLIGPSSKKMLKYAYGYWQNDSSSLILSNGITKLADSTGMFHYFNNLYASDIEEINIKPSDTNRLVFKKSKIY